MGRPFNRIAYDYSRADWGGLCDHLTDAPWEDISKLSASEFCDWVRVGTDVYSPNRKYQVKPHMVFSSSCCCHSSYRNHFFSFVATE